MEYLVVYCSLEVVSRPTKPYPEWRIRRRYSRKVSP